MSKAKDILNSVEESVGRDVILPATKRTIHKSASDADELCITVKAYFDAIVFALNELKLKDKKVSKVKSIVKDAQDNINFLVGKT